jgi:hypothetical protein
MTGNENEKFFVRADHVKTATEDVVDIVIVFSAQTTSTATPIGGSCCPFVLFKS